jgi:predicted small secreted protein|tara:strand:+ start:292 stop:480 length:189 start_codon:yes stop_codon:yes gene_type:complete
MKIGYDLYFIIGFILGLGVVIFVLIQLLKNIKAFIKNPLQEIKNNLGIIIVFVICAIIIILV